MLDIFVDSYGNSDFSLVNDSKSLSSQIGVFLVSKFNEIDYKTNYGLDYRNIILNMDVDISLKEKHIISQLNGYFRQYLKMPPRIVSKQVGRTYQFKVKYLDIWGGENTIEI